MNGMKRFLYNGMLLTLSALVVRAVGISFNVFISSRVGAEGMGLFQLVMAVYSPALTLATAGVFLCSSRLVAEELAGRRGGAWRGVLSRCLLYALLCSLPVSLMLFFLAPYISRNWLGDGGAEGLIRLLSISLPFIALSSCLNGFFTAVRCGGRSAALQLLEQGFKIAFTLFLIAKTSGNGVKCLNAVVLGGVGADVFSFLTSSVLSIGLIRRLPRGSGGKSEGASKRILGITLPVSASSFLRSSLVALEHILIPRGLSKSGASFSEAMASYGTLTGMAMPIIFFPTCILHPFASLTVPELAEEQSRGDSEALCRKIRRIFGAFLTFSVGVSVLVFCYSDLLGGVIYGKAEVSTFLTVLSPLIPFMYLDTLTDAMLKGIGEQLYTMRINVIDALASVIAVTLLVPKMGIMGYVAVILISELINFGFSLRRLKKVTGVCLGVKEKLPRILLFAVWSAFLSVLLTRRLQGVSPTVCLIFGASIYLICFSASVTVFGVGGRGQGNKLPSR